MSRPALAVCGASGPRIAIGSVVSSLLVWGVLMFDLALHLGLMVNLESGELQHSLGWPNRLTELRGLAAVWVAWGAHWATGGSYIPFVLFFLPAPVTDPLGGWLGRPPHPSTPSVRASGPLTDRPSFTLGAISLSVVA